MKSEKGITLITLVITIIIMLILIVTVTVNIGPYRTALLRNSFEEDMNSLKEAIANYYTRNKELPVVNKYINTFMLSDIKNVNDGNDYYVIDIRQLDVDLHYGREFYNTIARDIDSEIDDLLDVYIINEQSHTIYYPKGINYSGVIYYTLPEEFSYVKNASSDSEPPQVSIVMLPSDEGINYGVRSVVKISDSFSGVDFSKCKYIYTRSNVSLGTDEELYTEGDITEAKTIIDKQKEAGDDGWYLHVLAVDNAGNKIEVISQNSIVVIDRHDVIYHSNTTIDTTITAENASQIEANSFTAPTAKEFIKWNTSADGTGTDYNIGDPVEEDLELYAKWDWCVRNNNMYTKTTNSTFVDNTIVGNNTITIPAGYRMTSDTDKINDGIVIEDSSGNQWVWVPVDDITAIIDTYDPAQTTSGSFGTTTTYGSKSNVMTGQARNNVGLHTGLREPDIVTSVDKDSNTSYLSAAGFTATTGENAKTATQVMEEALVNDYAEMVNSIDTYGGFYIGRFELTGSVSAPTLKKGLKVLVSTNWYNFFGACKIFGQNNDKIETRMIWGVLWDATCLYISTKGNTVDITDSRSYGNCNDAISPANILSSETLCKSGYSEYWKTHNIYDLAGNAWEATQEAENNGLRSSRGGGHLEGGIVSPVSKKGTSKTPANGSSVRSTRPVLYLKVNN